MMKHYAVLLKHTSDTRFKDYFNSYDNQNLASYISEAVNIFWAMRIRATIFNPHTGATTLNTPTKNTCSK